MAKTQDFRTLADDLRVLTDARRARYAADVTTDEKEWARDAYEQTVPRLRRIAERGTSVAAINISETDVAATSDGAFLRGGGAALKKLLEDQGLKVTLGERYAGHAYGQFFLEVHW